VTEAIGIDIGGLGFKAARIAWSQAASGEAPRIEVIEEKRCEVGALEQAPQGAVAALAALASTLDPEARLPLGLAVPGAVRAEDGVVTTAANFPQWCGFDIGADLRRATGRAVAVGNDANLFAFAESRLGAARGRRSLLALTLGTGLGGGIVIDGRPYLGDQGLAAEVGHLHFAPDGAACGCGARGCIEQYASTLFLAREAPRRGLAEILAGQPPSATGRLLAEAARSGQRAAQGLFSEMGRNLGLAVGGLLNVLDLQSVLVGGGLSLAYDLFGPSFETTLRGRVFPAIAESLVVGPAELGPRAGAIGAALWGVEASS
jgi:glucokinase